MAQAENMANVNIIMMGSAGQPIQIALLKNEGPPTW
ncbi:hypothetical protein PAAG_12601 [Paracoccidioides lutzii Pb01]|uniref:Uncharacterized protein n=1 Tax=Paracoccidioides lutzii (strain ATCC MYA-826 / Pb01) TaxID=502779 RepID=A0A0A2V304_PARBA|nr:hypothetical protein PAAG_12601 [Paracoccidioides lutzii Pb01]KGQ00737.1 hypothetical protein PAAG_12601 [Paracoccidioides lutzii Pb01]